MRGHYVRVQPSGAKSYVTVARDPLGKQVWTTIGSADILKIDEAREKAREIIGRVRAGLPGLDAPRVKPVRRRSRDVHASLLCDGQR